MTAQFQSLVTASVAIGGRMTPLGTFQTRTGGETTSETSKYRPGGMQKQKVRKGQSDTGDVTITREHEQERDIDLERQLRVVSGYAEMVVSDQPLGSDGTPFGKPTTYTGTLMSVNGGDSDAESSDGRVLELVMMVTEVA